MTTTKHFTILQRRADEKLEYADIHLNELRTYSNATSNDIGENSHQESCFYHLAGAVEAILHEINSGYGLDLSIDQVTWTRVREKLKQMKTSSPAFDLLDALRSDEKSWLKLLFEWRNTGAHRKRVSKVIYASTHQYVDNEFTDPRTGKLQTVFPDLGCLSVLERLRDNVSQLIDECRTNDPRI